MHRLLAILFPFCFAPSLWADEAMLRDGKRVDGQLVITAKEQRFLTVAVGSLPLGAIAWVRFPDPPAPAPAGRLIHQLRFGSTQQLSGTLVKLDDELVHFTTGWGTHLKLPRSRIAAIVQPDDLLALSLDGLNDATAFELVSGKAHFVDETRLTGKRSLLISPDHREARFAWKRSVPTNGRISLHFQDALDIGADSWTIAFHLDGPKSGRTTSVSRVGTDYRMADGHALRASKGWHIMHLEWTGRQVRLFVDDHLLGTKRFKSDLTAPVLSFTWSGKNKSGVERELFVDDVQIAARIAADSSSLDRGSADPTQDAIELASGDQIYGQIRNADATQIVLKARFGTKTFPWSKVRGILLRPQKEKLAQAEVWFRTGPGITADMLRGELIDLDDGRLLLRHEVLGDIAIDRRRLERILFLCAP